jgi:hypothetical protein
MDKTNDAKCSSELAPENLHCDMWSSFTDCEWCETGWSSELISENSNKSADRVLQTEGVCRKGTNPGCKYTGWYIGINMCFVCIQGFPREDYHVCEPYAGQPESKNCMWGAKDDQGPLCFRCNPGYVVKDRKCVLSSSEGCLMMDSESENSCAVCNIWTGYQMPTDDGKCAKLSDSNSTSSNGRNKLIKLVKKLKKQIINFYSVD